MPNCFEDMPFFTHNVEVMLNDELKPNFAELLRTSANLSARVQLLGEVPSFAPVLNQFWRLATSNCKKV